MRTSEVVYRCLAMLVMVAYGAVITFHPGIPAWLGLAALLVAVLQGAALWIGSRS